MAADLRVTGLDERTAREIRTFARMSGIPVAEVISRLWVLRSEVDERFLASHGLELRTL